MQNLTSIRNVCSYCGDNDLFNPNRGNFKRCGACHAAMYCDAEHQQADWKPRHRAFCKRLAELQSNAEGQAPAGPTAQSVTTAFGKYMDAIQQPLRVALDSAFHAQDGDKSYMTSHFLSATFIFNESVRYSDTADRFTLLTIERRAKADAPAELKQFVESSDNGAVHLLSLVISRGVAEVNVNTFNLVPYQQLGFEAYPYLSSWADWLVEELKEPNPYGDPLVTAMKRLNADEEESSVDRLRAEKTLWHRYPDADPRAELWMPRKYTTEETAEAERLGYGRALKKKK